MVNIFENNNSDFRFNGIISMISISRIRATEHRL